jgi:hypothetical protein
MILLVHNQQAVITHVKQRWVAAFVRFPGGAVSATDRGWLARELLIFFRAARQHGYEKDSGGDRLIGINYNSCTARLLN